MNEQLIEQLAQGLKKSGRTWTPKQMLVFMLFLSVSFSLIMTLVMGTRWNIGHALERVDFRLELIILMGLGFGSYFVAARTAIPGLFRAPQRVFWALLFLMIPLVGLFLQQPAHEAEKNWSSGWTCFVLISANAFVPIVAVLVMLRKQAAPTHPLLTMAFVLLGSLGIAVATQHVICKVDETWHLIAWHLGVFPAGLLLARGLGRKILGW